MVQFGSSSVCAVMMKIPLMKITKENRREQTLRAGAAFFRGKFGADCLKKTSNHRHHHHVIGRKFAANPLPPQSFRDIQSCYVYLKVHKQFQRQRAFYYHRVEGAIDLNCDTDWKVRFQNICCTCTKTSIQTQQRLG